MLSHSPSPKSRRGTADPEFTFRPKELRGWRNAGLVALFWGVAVAWIAYYVTVKESDVLYLSVLTTLAAILILFGLATVLPRSLRIHGKGMVPPTSGLLGRVIGPSWVDYEDVESVWIIRNPDEEVIRLKLRRGREISIPYFQFGDEGAERLRLKLPAHVWHEDEP